MRSRIGRVAGAIGGRRGSAEPVGLIGRVRGAEPILSMSGGGDFLGPRADSSCRRAAQGGEVGGSERASSP